jgi:transposase
MLKGSKKRLYTREFREAAVRLVLTEKVAPARAAADLGMPVNTLTVWVSQARRGKGSFAPPGGVDWEKRARELEAENRRLKIERDILKKATAFFAKEEGGRP